MGGAISTAGATAALLAIGFFVEPLFPLGDWRWLGVAVLAITPSMIVYRRQIWQFLTGGGKAARGNGAQPSSPAEKRRKESLPDVAAQEFDMPIREALEHLRQTIPHSYRDSASADRHFFGLLHSQMCDGELSVIARKDESGALEQISALECKLLKPMEAVVPKNLATPLGLRFSLFDLHIDPPIEYSDLRVRKRDFFGIWLK